jgi:hypothetical protein
MRINQQLISRLPTQKLRPGTYLRFFDIFGHKLLTELLQHKILFTVKADASSAFTGGCEIWTSKPMFFWLPTVASTAVSAARTKKEVAPVAATTPKPHGAKCASAAKPTVTILAPIAKNLPTLRCAPNTTT